MGNSAKMVGQSKDVDRNPRDFYPTPAPITESLFGVEEFEGSAWEPACGDGDMSEVIKKHIDPVMSTDIVEGYGKGLDFLSDFETAYMDTDNIITNPPYKEKATQFIRKSKTIANNKIAMFLRLDYLHGKNRYAELWNDRTFPLKAVYVLVRRPLLKMEEMGDEYGTGMLTYAWFVWDKQYQGDAIVRWINNDNNVATKKPEPGPSELTDWLDGQQKKV